MRELTQPYLDPYNQRRSADWLVVERGASVVQVHRFTDQDDAAAFVARAHGLVDHPELDTDDKEADFLRETQ